MWGWSAGMGWWMIFGGILMVIFWVGIIWLIVWGVRRATYHGPEMHGTRSPLDIAKERYARGEITKEQFDQIKRDLS